MYKYLMQHQQVCIPGIGIFYKQRTAAHLDFSNKVFQPPAYTILFREEPVKADKDFYSFLSNEQGVNEVEAIRHFQDFAYRFKEHLSQFSQTDLPGLGVMHKGSDGALLFTPGHLLANYFPATPAERIVRKQSEHTMLVGDNETTNTQMQERLDEDQTESKSWWWIGAIVLGVLAIIAIVYYYMQHDGIRF